MKRLQFFAFGLLALAFCTGVADAQRKGARKANTARSTAAKPTVQPLDVRAAREKVDVQLSNVNEFLNKLGTIAQGLQVADGDAKAGNLKPATVQKIESKKAEIVDAIRNIKAGLSNLESEFRTKPVLQKYLPNVEGITELSAQSEDAAIGGKFVGAKDPLRNIAQKLTDALNVIPR